MAKHQRTISEHSANIQRRKERNSAKQPLRMPQTKKPRSPHLLVFIRGIYRGVPGRGPGGPLGVEVFIRGIPRVRPNGDTARGVFIWGIYGVRFIPGSTIRCPRALPLRTAVLRALSRVTVLPEIPPGPYYGPGERPPDKDVF